MAIPATRGRLVELNFTPKNEVLLQSGLKIATTRRTVHGEIGDVFRVGGSIWEIRAVVPTELRHAAAIFYGLEGEPSPGYFLDEWARCYGISRGEVDPYLEVYVHIFWRVPEPRVDPLHG